MLSKHTAQRQQNASGSGLLYLVGLRILEVGERGLCCWAVQSPLLVALFVVFYSCVLIKTSVYKKPTAYIRGFVFPLLHTDESTLFISLVFNMADLENKIFLQECTHCAVKSPDT